MKTITLTKGKVALIDDADYALVCQYRWYPALMRSPNRKVWYAVSHPEVRTLSMHRFILDAADGELVDHRDHDGLNNQRENLRIATHAQSNANRRSYPGTTSQFKGVIWYASRRLWRATIGVNGSTFFLGDYDDETIAALAYDMAASRLYGEFACLNFPASANVLIGDSADAGEAVALAVRSAFAQHRHPAMRTHCRQGHEMSGGNVLMQMHKGKPNGIERVCLACKKAWYAKSRQGLPSLMRIDGERLYQLRRELGWSQRRLSLQIGYDISAISRIEHGIQASMGSDTLKKLVQALGCTTDYLCGMYDDESERVAADGVLAAN
jgi:hypothetical protein